MRLNKSCDTENRAIDCGRKVNNLQDYKLTSVLAISTTPTRRHRTKKYFVQKVLPQACLRTISPCFPPECINDNTPHCEDPTILNHAPNQRRQYETRAPPAPSSTESPRPPTEFSTGEPLRGDHDFGTWYVHGAHGSSFLPFASIYIYVCVCVKVFVRTMEGKKASCGQLIRATNN